MKFLLLCTLLATVTFAQHQPQYAQQQYAPQQYPQQQYAQPAQIQYRPLAQAQYLVAGGQAQPVYEQAEAQSPQYYSRQSLAQPLLGSVDRQIQKAAHHVAGPEYAQQIQSIQLQGRAVQAQDQIQRNALRLASVPKAQPLQYQRALQSSQPAPKILQQEEESGEQYNSNPSYQFGFDVKDDLYTNYHTRKEQREGDKITGSYSVVDSDGFLRTVTYTADPKEGFKAEVNRQPTDIVVKIPQQPQQKLQQQQYQAEAQAQRQQPQYYQVPVTIGGQYQQQGGQVQDKQQRYQYQ